MPASIEKVSSGINENESKNIATNNKLVDKSTIKTETVNLSSAQNPDFYVDDFTEYYVRTKGYMVGDNTGFNPEGEMTRAQMVQILYAMEGKPKTEKSSFSDVQGDAWYADAVAWAQKEGIVAGHTDGTFRPNDKITNEQMAAIMKKYAEHRGYDTKTTGANVAAIDKLDRSNYSRDALEWASEHNMFEVDSIDKLNPKDTANRHAMATMLQEFDYAYDGIEAANVYYDYLNKKEKVQYERDREKYGTEAADRDINSIPNDFSSFNDLFNKEKYGGNQSDPHNILMKYSSYEEIMNDPTIGGQKAKILYDTAKKYYPDATFEDIKMIAEAYNQCGCGYMATADAFMLQVSSLSNGEEVFKKTMGYDLYSKYGSAKSCNIECLAFEEYLFKNKGVPVNKLIAKHHATHPDGDELNEFYKSKNIDMDAKRFTLSDSSPEAYEKMMIEIGKYGEEHPDAVYPVTGYNFNMITLSISETAGLDPHDPAFMEAIKSGNLIENVPAHAVFLTGITEDHFIVSSWGKKYAIPISESFKNGSYKENGITYDASFYVCGMDFDFSKVGGKK